jgi:histone H3/H4
MSAEDDDVKSLDTRAPGDDADDGDDGKSGKSAGGGSAEQATQKTKKQKAEPKEKGNRRKQASPTKNLQLKKVAKKNADAKEKRKHRFKPGTVARRQIAKYQKSTDPIIPRSSFKRFIKEIAGGIADNNTFFADGVRFKRDAIDALRAGVEDELVTLFNLGNAMNIDIGKSVTLSPYAFRMAYNLRHKSYLLTGGLARRFNSKGELTHDRPGSLLPSSACPI